MERVATLIYKLLDQYQNQVGAGKMMMTAQMLLSELQQYEQASANGLSNKVTVVIPSVVQAAPEVAAAIPAAAPSAVSAQQPIQQKQPYQQYQQYQPAASWQAPPQPAPVPKQSVVVQQPAQSVSVQQPVSNGQGVSQPPVTNGHQQPVLNGQSAAVQQPAAHTQTAALQQQNAPANQQPVYIQQQPSAAQPYISAQQQTLPPFAPQQPAANPQQSWQAAQQAYQVPPQQTYQAPAQQQQVQDDVPVAQPAIPSVPPAAVQTGKGWQYDPVHDVPTLVHQGANGSSDVNSKAANGEASLNEKLKVEKIELGSVLQESPIRDLKKAIAINDRYVFIAELFRGDETMYERSLKTINGFNILPEAQYWIQRELKVKLGWNEQSDIVAHFDQLVRRRFS
ncbi:hypothetical protein HNQ91_000377 [Filimonas zeae]|uniref:Uncharacterized protein n=1 Tax=Filimonas zeae TaxID=1737353 RepID=A0A917MQF8_9BACT|nr:hypothetical protein [Filimonas zeae]MDR6337355.1 hypothetical protein [Filimonas zeae]GGH58205.1 hypothetical protein GCM10011379_03710 [Filimonas zeae]